MYSMQGPNFHCCRCNIGQSDLDGCMPMSISDYVSAPPNIGIGEIQSRLLYYSTTLELYLFFQISTQRRTGHMQRTKGTCYRTQTAVHVCFSTARHTSAVVPEHDRIGGLPPFRCGPCALAGVAWSAPGMGHGEESTALDELDGFQRLARSRPCFDSRMRVTAPAPEGRKEGAKHIKT